MGDWEYVKKEDDPEDESKHFVFYRVTYNGEDELLNIYHFDKPNLLQKEYWRFKVYSEAVIPGTLIEKAREGWIDGTVRGREW